MIPKVLHACWFSGDPYPELFKRCLASWSQQLPDYKIQIWDATAIEPDFPPWVSEAMSVRKYAFVADYFRLHVLYTHGGIYLDADVEVVGRFDRFLELQSFIGRETGGDPEPAVIGAMPKTAWLKTCLDYYTNRSFIQSDGRRDMKPLPIVVHEILAQAFKLDLTDISRITECPDMGLTVFPPDYFSPKNRFTGSINVTENTKTIHHFDGHWVDRGASVSAKNALHLFLQSVLNEKSYFSVRNFLRRMQAK